VRGELWTVAGGVYASKPRPALVIQNDAFAETGSVTVLPLTTTRVDAPLLRVPIAPSADNGLAVSMDIQLTANNCQDMAGLTPDQFTQNVKEAWISMAMIMTIPHSVVLLECNSAADAQTVKSAIAAGFDPHKWICVIPEQCFVVEAGSWVLFAATRNDVAAALQTAFKDLAGGQTGAVNKFYDAAGDNSGLPTTFD